MRAAAHPGKSDAAAKNNNVIIAQRELPLEPPTVSIGTYPSPTSLAARVLAHLLTGASLTSREWWITAGASRLASDIHKLRTLGWVIVSDEIRVQTSDGGRASRVAMYVLDDKQRRAALRDTRGSTE